MTESKNSGIIEGKPVGIFDGLVIGFMISALMVPASFIAIKIEMEGVPPLLGLISAAIAGIFAIMIAAYIIIHRRELWPIDHESDE